MESAKSRFCQQEGPSLVWAFSKYCAHNILCLSDVCTIAATSACDWLAGTHVSQLSQSQAEVAAKVHMLLKQQLLCGVFG